MKLIIDIPEEIYKPFMRGNYSEWVSDWLSTHEYSLIRNGTPIPDNATNGDVIKAMFPQMNINEEWKATRHGDIVIDTVTELVLSATSDWWNASYQRGGKE